MADQCSHLGTVQFSAVFAQEARRGGLMSKSQLAMSALRRFASGVSSVQLDETVMWAETRGMLMCNRLNVAHWPAYRVAKNT